MLPDTMKAVPMTAWLVLYNCLSKKGKIKIFLSWKSGLEFSEISYTFLKHVRQLSSFSQSQIGSALKFHFKKYESKFKIHPRPKAA